MKFFSFLFTWVSCCAFVVGVMNKKKNSKSPQVEEERTNIKRKELFGIIFDKYNNNLTKNFILILIDYCILYAFLFLISVLIFMLILLLTGLSCLFLFHFLRKEWNFPFRLLSVFLLSENEQIFLYSCGYKIVTYIAISIIQYLPLFYTHTHTHASSRVISNFL